MEIILLIQLNYTRKIGVIQLYEELVIFVYLENKYARYTKASMSGI